MTTAPSIVDRLTHTRARLASLGRLGRDLTRQASLELAEAAGHLWRQAARYRARRARRIRFPQHRLTWGLLDLLDPGRLPSLRGAELHPAADTPRPGTDRQPTAERPAQRSSAARPPTSTRDRASARPAHRPAARATGPRRDTSTPAAARTVTPLGERLTAAITAGPPGSGRWTSRALAAQVGCSRSTAWAYLRDRQPRQARPDRGRERDRARER